MTKNFFAIRCMGLGDVFREAGKEVVRQADTSFSGVEDHQQSERRGSLVAVDKEMLPRKFVERDREPAVKAAVERAAAVGVSNPLDAGVCLFQSIGGGRRHQIVEPILGKERGQPFSELAL
jgi:hypothetical protein